jgi:hypothetical protein
VPASDLREQLINHLGVAGARVGEPTHLTTGELVAIDTDHLWDNNSVLYLPAHIQKDY